MTRALAAALLLVAAALAACSPADTYVFVTVEDRPTVGDVAVLSVSIGNAGSTLNHEFTLDPGEALPQTFTVTTEGRSGDLDVAIDGRDAAGATIASGAGRVTVVPDGRADLTVTLDPHDFVVNQAVAGVQLLTFYLDVGGRQIAVGDDGSFLVSFENDCGTLGRCDALARLFDPTARPRRNETSKNENDFILNQTPEYTEVPTVAAAGGRYLAAWAAGPAMGDPLRIKAAALAADGSHVTTFDTDLSATTGERAPFAFALTDGRFVVTWERARVAPATGTEVRACVLDGDGNTVGADFPVSAVTTGEQTLPVGAALPGGGFVIVWTHREIGVQGTDVVARTFDAGGGPTGLTDVALTSYGAQTTYAAHVAPTAAGFVAGWQVRNTDGSRQLFLQRFDATAAALSGPVLVTDLSSDLNAEDAYTSIAVRRADGLIAASFHDCADHGDGGDCGIRARLLHPSGLPIGDPAVVNTTTAGLQYHPAMVPFGDDAFVVTWSDNERETPDLPEADAGGVRARVIYPVADRRDRQIGALCDTPADCDPGLACVADAEASPPLCHPTCTAAATPCPDGGVCDGTACLF